MDECCVAQPLKRLVAQSPPCQHARSRRCSVPPPSTKVERKQKSIDVFNLSYWNCHDRLKSMAEKFFRALPPDHRRSAIAMAAHWRSLPGLRDRGAHAFKNGCVPPKMRNPNRPWSCGIKADPSRGWTVAPIWEILQQCLAPMDGMPPGAGRFSTEHASAKCMFVVVRRGRR